MNSKTTDQFWKNFDELPASVKKQAKGTFTQFQKDPYHPSLHFKKIHSTRPIYSVRITKDYRVIGILQENDIIWFWVGSHSKYDKLIKQMRNT